MMSAPLDAHAQSSRYPNKSIRMLVGFTAGSATDVVARVVSNKLSERVGQPIVVDNRTGAGGTLAADAVAKAAPDGYTLIMASSAVAVNPAVYATLPFDVERDLTPIVFVGAVPTVMMVNRAVPARDLREFIQYAKAHPGQLNYGSSGVGGSIHMFSELLNSLAGTKMTHVPYKGNPQAGAALLAGEVSVLLDTAILAVSYLKSDKVSALAITGRARSPLAPDVPTFIEAGLPGFDAAVWFGVMAPSHLPKSIADKLNAEINEALKAADVRARLATGALEIVGGESRFFADLLRADVRKWKRVAQEAGVKAE